MKRPVGFAFLLVALLLTACGGAGSAASSPPASSGGDELTYAASTFGQENFDPSQTPTPYAGAGLGGPIFESLFMFMPPSGELKPYLLQSATMAADGMSWTFKLRDGIKFSNGDPMSADDVKFSLERYISNQSRTTMRKTLGAAISSMDVADRLTVKLNLRTPVIDLPNVFAPNPGSEGIVLPAKYIQKVGWKAFAEKPIGSGPYVLTDHKPGQSVTYAANPNYWRAKPLFKKITTLLIPEEQTRISMMESGKADLADISPINKAPVEKAGLKTLIIPDATTNMVQFIGAYGSYPDNPLKKLEVRKALTLAVDKKAILNALGAGLGELASIGPSKPGISPGAPELPATPYDPTEAKRLLAQAGYPNGFDLTFWATNGVCTADFSKQLGQTLGSYWQKIGVNTTISPVDYAVFRPKAQANPFKPETVGTAYPFCNGPQEGIRDLINRFYSKGAQHTSDLADPYIPKALAAKKLEDQQQYVDAAYRKVYENYAALPIYYGSLVFAADGRAAGDRIAKGVPFVMSWWVK
ncbi:MAG: ABC transporter substrate-binding protein [Chloroflexota bacterium]|nr:ABC transporter substrate-binding protein [Chloroflexota bacterium]